MGLILSNNKKSDHFAITLTTIYLTLVSLSVALYALIKTFIHDSDSQGMAVDLLSWSATLFATIALLYTFNSWRSQKELEVIASESKNIIKLISNLEENAMNILISINKKNNLDEIFRNTNEYKVLYQLVTSHLNFILQYENDEQNKEYIEAYKLEIYLIFFTSRRIHRQLISGASIEDDIFDLSCAFESLLKSHKELKSNLFDYALYYFCCFSCCWCLEILRSSRS